MNQLKEYTSKLSIMNIKNEELIKEIKSTKSHENSMNCIIFFVFL